MKNLPKDLKESLIQAYYLDPLSIAKIEISRDGSKKYLFALKDGNTVESVLLPMKQEEVLMRKGNWFIMPAIRFVFHLKLDVKSAVHFALPGKVVSNAT